MRSVIEIKDNEILTDRRVSALVDNNEVASISCFDGRWAVSSSQCLPSNIDDAERIIDAFNILFDHYSKIKNEHKNLREG